MCVPVAVIAVKSVATIILSHNDICMYTFFPLFVDQISPSPPTYLHTYLHPSDPMNQSPRQIDSPRQDIPGLCSREKQDVQSLKHISSPLITGKDLLFHVM